MKICILTQPLSWNYGGLLQAYALQLILKRMGHEVWTEDRKPNKLSLLDKLKRIRFLRNITGKGTFFIANKSEESILFQHTARFIRENIRVTIPIDNKFKSELNKYDFEAYVVGSDQVWRPCYSFGIYNYFLDFTRGQEVKRIAYAASFGVDHWEYTKKQTRRCSSLVKSFDAVSVREDSAISLCSNYLGIKATQVLDPTMLLDKEDYINLVLKDNISHSKGNLMAYVLDRSEEKKIIVNKIANRLNLKPFEVMPHSTFNDVGIDKIDDCIFSPVTKWIRGFMDAEFVVADSFHGCVFAIIFEKPFIAIVNKERGATRFTSLLTMFGLTNRVVNSLTEVTDEILNAPIDWGKVRAIRCNKVKESVLFLKNSLNGKR